MPTRNQHYLQGTSNACKELAVPARMKSLCDAACKLKVIESMPIHILTERLETIPHRGGEQYVCEGQDDAKALDLVYR